MQHPNIKQKIIEHLSQMRGGLGTAPDIAVACGVGYNEVTPVIAELIADGSIEIASERTKVECRTYRIVTGQKPAEQQQDLFA